MENYQEDKYMLPPLAEGPWLIATHENHKRNKLEKQTFITNNKPYLKTIPDLHHNVIESSHRGWLILRERANITMYSIWNPVTSRFLRLPELAAPEVKDYYIEPSVCIFTSSPDDVNSAETCVLLLFFDGGLVFSCRPTMGSNCIWIRHSLEIDGKGVKIERAEVLQGVIYAYASISNECTFVHMNVANDNLNSITLEPWTINRPDLMIWFQDHGILRYMVESCGVLYIIFLMYKLDDDSSYMDIIKVLVWRLDISQMVWIKVESLINCAFLLGTRCCTWCWVGNKSSQGSYIEENCIYLVKDNDPKLYKYNLHDDSYTISVPHSNFLNPFYGPTWFMPMDHHRFLPEKEGNKLGKHIQKTNTHFQDHVEDIQEVPATLIHKLPTEIWRLISVSKGMNLFDCMNLRSTCMTLRCANSLANWRANCPYPMLMVLKDSSGTYELLDPLENISRTISKVHSSPTTLSTIEFCKDGWMLIRSEGHSLKYLNPFTRERGDFPPHQTIGTNASMGFSTCPTSSDCLTVGIYGYKQITISFFQAATEEWECYVIEFNIDKDIEFRPNYKSSPMYYKDAFYFLGRDGCLGIFKVIQGDIRWHVHNSPFTEDTILNSCYLVELDGELVSVFFGEMGRWVRVFKFNIFDDHWLELHTLGDHILFVSHASSFSVVANKAEMKNRIYLPKRMGNEIVFYSLDSHKYHTPGRPDFLEDFCDMKAQSMCCWI